MIKFFEPLDGMIPAQCPYCHKAVESKEDGVLVQENTPGGNGAVMHKACVDAVMAQGD